MEDFKGKETVIVPDVGGSKGFLEEGSLVLTTDIFFLV